MSVSRKPRRTPTPASESAVSAALKHLSSEVGEGERSVQAFLDRIGFGGLQAPKNVAALSNATTRAVHSALPSRPLLASHVIMRIAECQPPPETESVAPALTTTYLWLAQCAGHAISHIGDESVKSLESPRLLELATFMPLNESRFSCHSLRKAILTHPDCPPKVLYYAATTWPIDDARTMDGNPNTPNEARVMLALRK